MPDQLDQISEAQTHAPSTSSARTEHTISFVYRLNGRWSEVTLEGTLSDCTDFVWDAVAKRGASLDKLPWARAHRDGRNIVVHPKNHSEAMDRAERLVKSNPKPKQLPKQYRRN